MFILIDKTRNLAKWLETIIKQFINESPKNTLKNDANEKAWAEPLVSFSSGADPLYQFYKKDIGVFYLSPLEIFNHTFPKVKIVSNQLTVISWILSQTELTKSEH